MITFILICFGLTQILVYGKIFEPVRKRLNWYVLNCAMCVGWYVGVIVFLYFYYIANIKLMSEPIGGVILYGCLSSGTSYVLCALFGDGGINVQSK